MKIGKFKKALITCGLAIVMVLSLTIQNNTVNAGDKSVTNAGPLLMAKSQNVDDGVYLNKTAKYNTETKLYDIQLEAYATGTIQSASKPVDVLLILDQSGSMRHEYGEISFEDLKVEVYNTLDSDRASWSDGSLDAYYISVQEWVEGYWAPFIGWVEGHYETKNYVLHHDNEGWYYKKSSDRYAKKFYISSSNLGENETIHITRQAAMLQALAIEGGFIDELSKNNNNKIGLLTFKDDGWSKAHDYTYGFVNDYSSVKNDIKNLVPNSGTYPNDSFELAVNRYFNETYVEANPDRQKVLIYFTDGMPGDGSSFSFSDSYLSVQRAKTLKDRGVTIYSVGCDEGMNPEAYISTTTFTGDDSEKTNQYMHAISSNYPKAYYDYGRYNSKIVSLGSRYQTSDGEIPNYYLYAGSPDALNDIFGEILEGITPSIPLDSTTILKDVMSNYFVISGDTEQERKQNVKVEKVQMTTSGWATTSTDITGSVHINSSDNKTIEVTGFNYTSDENVVVNNKQGYKLVVTISNVKPIDGFIGGNAVPTNSNESGIYKDTYSKEFNEPKVDVDINYNAMFNDAAMYAGDDWKDFYRFFNEIDDVIYYNIGSGNYTIDGSNNKYVNIEYQIKDGTDVIATYTINAGKTVFDKNISIKDEYLQEVQKFDKDHNYTISVNVQPSEDAIDDDLDNITIDEYQTQNNNKTLYLYVPHIETNDKKVMVDTKVNLDDDEIIKLIGWNSKTAASNLPQPSYNDEFNKEPDLNYTIKGPVTNSGSEYPNIETFTPTKDGKYIFEYIVENARNSGDLIDITDVSQHKNSCNIEPTCDKDDDNMFAIHVISGKITVIKNIDDTDLKVNLTDGDPIFTFKLEKIVNGKLVNTKYKTIKVNETNGQWTAQFDFDSLGEGTYKVTELETMRYEQISVTHNGQVTIDVEHLDHEIEFTNKVKSDDYFTDNDIVVNKFVIGDDGQMTVEKDYLN